MPPAVFNSFSTRPDGRSSRSPEPRMPTPSPRLPSPSSRATPRGHYSQLDAVTMAGDVLIPGCSGLVKTLPIGEEGISEKFLSLWLSSLCIHVHPKKQPKALGFLIARHVRAVAHKVIRAFHEHVLETHRRRQLNKKAILHWLAYLCGDAIRGWRGKAIALRVARIRLRTVVSRWLRVELGQLFAGWTEQVEITRDLFVASERVTQRHHFLCIERKFKEWNAHLEEQEHKKNVLTKIVLRIQDRTLMKALQAWLQLASSLAIIKHLAERGYRKYKTATLLTAFQSWQDLRTRGFKAMDMMDMATAKWNKMLLESCFSAIKDVTQHTKLCNSRGLLIWNRVIAREEASVVERWKFFHWTRQRLSTIFEVVQSACNRGRLVFAFRHWSTRVETIRTRYGLLRKGLGYRCARDQRSTFARWQGTTVEQKVLRRTWGLVSSKHDLAVQRSFISAWKDQTELSLQLLALHDRIEVRHNTAVAQDLLSTWSNATKANAAVRAKGLAGMRVGAVVFSRSVRVSFRGWDRETQRVRQLEASSELNRRREALSVTFERWIDNAAALGEAGARFERALYRSEAAQAGRFLSLWVDEHTRAVTRSNRLMTQMMVWDRRRVCAAFHDWRDELAARRRLRRSIAANTIRQMMARARSVMAEWGAAAYWSRATRAKGERLAERHLAAMARAHMQAWHRYARSVKLADRGLGRIRHRIAWELVDECVGAWAQLTAETSHKALVISRCDTKLLFNAARRTLHAWADAKLDAQLRARKILQMDMAWAAKTLRAAAGEWRGWYSQQAQLRLLRERCLTRWLSSSGERAFERWGDATGRARALRGKERSILNRTLFRTAAGAVSMWVAEATRLRKLRRGLGRLVGGRVDKTQSEVLCEWQRAGLLSARHERVAQACASSLLSVMLSSMLGAWAVTAHELQRQSKGVAGLTARVGQRAAGAAVQGWDAAVRLGRMHARISLVIIDRARRRLARQVVVEWRWETEEQRLFGERAARMGGAMAQVATSDVVFWWRKLTRDTRRRFEGLHRCLSRVRARASHAVLAGWFEAAAFKQRQRSTVRGAAQRRAWATMGEAVHTMRHAAVVGRWFGGKASVLAERVLRRVLEGWLHTCADLAGKRRELSLILRRVELRGAGEAFAGWADEVRVVKSLFGRAQVVEARNASVQAAGAVLKLLQHAKTRRRHRRLERAFYQRWYVACLKNFYEAWRTWYGKKMAVKGVLDQVVEMM